MDLSVDDTLDTTGLLCPEPVMMLHNKIREIEAGDILKIIATDPSTQRDIPKFCGFLGHQLLQQQTQGSTYIYFIQKALK
jgi:tRNA 2-thiouridine synthesizing protein A